MEALQQDQDSIAEPGAHGQPGMAHDVDESKETAGGVRGQVRVLIACDSQSQ